MVIVHWASRVMEFSAKISMRYLSSFMSLVVVRALSIVEKVHGSRRGWPKFGWPKFGSKCLINYWKCLIGIV